MPEFIYVAFKVKKWKKSWINWKETSDKNINFLYQCLTKKKKIKDVYPKIELLSYSEKILNLYQTMS